MRSGWGDCCREASLQDSDVLSNVKFYTVSAFAADGTNGTDASMVSEPMSSAEPSLTPMRPSVASGRFCPTACGVCGIRDCLVRLPPGLGSGSALCLDILTLWRIRPTDTKSLPDLRLEIRRQLAFAVPLRLPAVPVERHGLDIVRHIVGSIPPR